MAAHPCLCLTWSETPQAFHEDNMSVCFLPPYTPLLYSKAGVYRGIHFYIIALKHRLRVLVSTVLTCNHNICFKQKYKKKNPKNSTENFHFYSREKSLYIAWACFRKLIFFQGMALCLTISFAFYAYFYFDHLHFHVTHAYAHLGYQHAQHQVGQRYLHGKSKLFYII